MTSHSFSRLCLAAGLALALAVTGRAASDPQFFLPDDCHVISVTRVKDVLNSPAFKSLKDVAKDLDVPGLEEDKVKDTMGLDPGSVIMITSAMSLGKLDELAKQVQDPDSTPPMIMVAQVDKPVQAAAIKAAIKGKEFTETKVGSFTMHEAKDLAFCVADEQTVVYGPPSLLKQVLERNKAPQLSASMEQAMKELSAPKAVALAVALKDLVAKPEVQQNLQAVANPQVKMFVNELEGLVLQVGVADDIDVGLGILMKTEKAADELRKLTEGTIAVLRLQFGANMPKEAAEIVNSIKLGTDGAKLQASVAIKTASLVKLIKDAAKNGLQ